MSNNLSVVVLTPHGRRNTVKCNSNTTILQILEQTCTKHNFNADEYDLKHHNHVLDVTLTFRFSGLPNNASLEMVAAKTIRKESEVVLGLQLESGERKMGNFIPSSSLYDIITTLDPEQSRPETNPVVIYMRSEVHGEEALRSTTLKSLGLTGGKAMVRLIHRTPDQLKTQANVSSPLVAKPKEADDEISFNTTSILSSTKLIEPLVFEEKSANDSGEKTQSIGDSKDILNETVISDSVSDSNQNTVEQMDTSEPSDSVVNGNSTSKMEEDTSNVIGSQVEIDESQLESEIVVLGERNALVFSQDMSSQLPYDDMPDDFYDLSVNEVRKLFQDLVHKREEMENTPLQISLAKKLEEDKKVLNQLHDYHKVVLRVAFPDRTVLQGTFRPLDTVKTVMDFVREYLENPQEAFDLYVTPPKQVLNPEQRLIETQCVPSALVYFGPCVPEAELTTISGRRYLRKDILDKLTSPEAARFSASKARGIAFEKSSQSYASEVASPSSSNKSSDVKKQTRTQPFSVPGPSKSKDTKVPKWFKPS